MPLYMLDTDTVSYLIRGKAPALDAHMAAVSPRHVCISAVTRGELLYGLKLKEGAHQLARLVDQFLLRVQCLPWDEAAATHFASVAAELHKAGTQIGSMDAMIAGHAMATSAVLVTNNARHFSRVAGLKVENWYQEH
ncbi:MAG TPA: type II toxin-antitoxin system VapC family toxin [Burkholderiales bacterium]